MKNKIFEKFAPNVTIDRYLAALEKAKEGDTAELEQIIKELVGTQLTCKAYIYRNGDKFSITLHTLEAGKTKAK